MKDRARLCILLDTYEQKLNQENEIVDCEYFTTSLYEIDQPVSKDMAGLDSFMIVICVGGQGSLTDSEGNTVTLRQGETVLLPASTKSFTLSPEGSMKALTSYIR